MDIADRAQAREQLDIDMAMRAHRARAAQDVGNGICRDCGEPIDARRLAVNPAAVRCVQCQGSEELRSFHRYGRAA